MELYAELLRMRHANLFCRWDQRWHLRSVIWYIGYMQHRSRKHLQLFWWRLSRISSWKRNYFLFFSNFEFVAKYKWAYVSIISGILLSVSGKLWSWFDFWIISACKWNFYVMAVLRFVNDHLHGCHFSRWSIPIVCWKFSWVPHYLR